MGKTKTIKIVEIKLGRQKAAGQYWKNKIEIDPRQDSKDYLDTLIHEMLHHECPWLDEMAVRKIAPAISKVVWKQGYRRIKK